MGGSGVGSGPVGIIFRLGSGIRGGVQFGSSIYGLEAMVIGECCGSLLLVKLLFWKIL